MKSDFLYEDNGRQYNVILYGAGKAGKDAYLSFGCFRQHIRIVAVIDDYRRNIHGLEHLGEFVEPIKNINKYLIDEESLNTESNAYKIDFIVIAAQSETTWYKMKANVIDIGIIPEDRILIYTPPTSKQLLLPRMMNNAFLCERIYKLFEYMCSRGEEYRDLVYDELKAWSNIIKHEIIWLNYREWHANEDKTCAYLQMPKVASTSLTKTIRKIPDDLLKGGKIVSDIEGPTRYYYDLPSGFSGFKFTFVRNPFARVVSCYKNKIEGREKSKLRYFKVIGLEKDYGFETYVKSICEIPDEWAERHFATQYFQVYKQGKCIVDYIGKFENLLEEYEVIRTKYGLDPLEHKNSSSKYDYRDYYTEELVNLVYRRYKIDFETFGYEDEYERLMSYVKARDTIEESKQ